MKADRASVLVAAEPLERRLALAVAAFADSPVTINPVGGTIPIAVSPPMLSGDALFAQAAKTVADNVAGKPAAEVESYAGSLAGSLAIMQRTLLERLGKSGRDQLVASHSASLGWLLGDRDAIQMLLSSGDAAGGRWADAGRIFLRIVDGDARAKSGIPLRIAVATALTFAEPVISFADKKAIDPLPRYQAYRDWDAAGQLFSSFRSLTAWEMRYVVGSWARESELVWARSAIRRDLKSRDRVSDAAFMVPYTAFNKRGVSIQDEKNFYDSKPITMALLLEYGAVCGGISKFGTAMCQAFGVPAMPVGQPGHCAFLWQKSDRTWAINNDISGWAESSRHDGISTTWGNPSWVVQVMQAAQSNGAGFAAAERLRAVAPLAAPAVRADILAAACRVAPLDYAAWTDRAAALATAKAPLPQWQAAATGAATAYARHPMAYAAVLNRLEPGLLPSGTTSAARQAFVVNAAKTLAGMARGGALPDLVAGGLRSILQHHAGRLASGFGDQVARILAGEPASGSRMSSTAARAIVPLFTAAVDALDVATSGPAYSAWRIAAERTSRGLVLEPGTRVEAIAPLTASVRRLQAAKRLADARWLADVLVDAASKTGDSTAHQTLRNLRTSLG